MKDFALIGAAGHIARKHLRAIQETGNRLVAAVDPFDVMGRLDSFFPEAEFFLDCNSFERFVADRKKNNHPINYFSICSPNYLHAAHIQSALRHQAFAICEKPLVLYPEEIETIEKAEQESGCKVFNILQLRLHPAIAALREKVKSGPAGQVHDIDLTYITPRGKWYFKSWKGDVDKSGGIAANIGIHFFDMLTWIFGEVQRSTVHLRQPDKAAGLLELKTARVRWFLSIDFNDLPAEARQKGLHTYRSITMEGHEIEFSDGFSDLHTESYRQILSGQGFGLGEAAPCIRLAHQIRNTQVVGARGDYHPFFKQR
ncbi:Gfo/Idh/MocA family protein [Gaoshiqia sediminis]|uniref:Gfo/Idh/MocA family oxidoreductase n=1 Tax=Gaoshiqia sediminis TaxID=2986998 RepID=A0AA41Y6D5_9BACT|nr:Gfo/Idh/MocA family oxidoreductase [Gaoshiqia sediminis]MCW0482685.1 Gfo/Idh/MocA family oxidoreductase [Gaoshiqia sediminis]